MFTVRFTRDSVCMGDDISDNSRDIEFYDDSADVRVLIPTLKANSFLPSILGNDVMWTIVNAFHEPILDYYTKWGIKKYHVRRKKHIKDVCGGKMTLHCVYYSNYRKG